MLYLQRFYKTLCLAYQSLGVVYGDLSISPIYVYKSTFSGSLRSYKEDHEILGVLSLVFWTLTLIPLCKYIVFVLAADDNGEGAHNDPHYILYSLYSSYELVVIFHLNAMESCFYRWNLCFVFSIVSALKGRPFEYFPWCKSSFVFLQHWNSHKRDKK